MILMATILVAYIPAISAQEKDFPWNTILFDVSSDVLSHDKSGQSEINLFNTILDEISHQINSTDSISVFAGGRAIIPLKFLLNDSKHNFDHIRLCIGDGTRIYDAILSIANTVQIPQRLLIVTNGLNNGSSFHSKTVSKILRNKGIVVDALCFYLDADSVAMDSVFSKKPKFDKKFSKTIESTGGRFVSVIDRSNLHSAFKSLLITAGSTKPQKRGAKLEYDNVLLSKTLNRITTNQLHLVEVDTCTCIKYNGVVFKGLNDIYKHVNDTHSGVYIGIDKSKYPCFDEFDRQNENRCFQNIYFADSPQKIAMSKQIIEQTRPILNYCKLYNGTPFDVLPLIYYSGEGEKMLICGLEIEAAP